MLLAWFVSWWRRTPAGPALLTPGASWVWALLVTVGVLVGGTAALSAPTLDLAGLRGVTSGGGAVLAAATLVGVGRHAVRRRER